MSNVGKGLSYAQAGVDIAAGNALVERIKPAAAGSTRAGTMAGHTHVKNASPNVIREGR